ncbi:MAG: glycoside hydrolase family 3 N-terminal domain-containing protein [Streptosporangiaceae bacterium]|jgi:beta-N-acetylhexosaminidase
MSVIDTALTRLADGILMPPFYGPAAPPWVLDALADGLAGVVLFGSNVADGPQPLRELTGSMLSAAPDALIAIDEEGGDVTRLWYASGSPYPGNAALGAADDTEMTREVYRSIGADLAGLSINLNLAPCLDVLAEPENPVIGTRAFGMTAELVARHGVAAVLGLQSAGVAACVKHFPGHGSTLADSHATLAVVTDGWAERDLPPFTAAIEAGTAAVMPGHLRVPGLTGTAPASLSPEAIALIRSLGFDGVVVSDALEMRAVSDVYGVAGAAVLAVVAGTDLLCLGRDVSADGYLATREALVAAVRDGTIPAGRLEEATARVAALRLSLSSRVLPAAPPMHELGLVAARRALRLTGARPALTQPVVVEIEPLVNIAAGSFHWGLADWIPADSLRRVSPDADASAVLKPASDRDLVLLYRDAHRSAGTRALVTAVLAERPDAVPVEMGLPFWRPQAATFIATYGASRASSEATAEILGLA